MHAGCSKQCCGLETQVHFVKISVSRPDGQGLGLKTLTRYLTYWWTEYRLHWCDVVGLKQCCLSNSFVFGAEWPRRSWFWDLKAKISVLVLRLGVQGLGLHIKTWWPRSQVLVSRPEGPALGLGLNLKKVLTTTLVVRRTHRRAITIHCAAASLACSVNIFFFTGPHDVYLTCIQF